MSKLRKWTKQHSQMSKLIFDACRQTHISAKQNEIDAESAHALHTVFKRMHTSICVDGGLYDRARQERYDRRHPSWKDHLFTIFVILATALLSAGYFL